MFTVTTDKMTKPKRDKTVVMFGPSQRFKV